MKAHGLNTVELLILIAMIALLTSAPATCAPLNLLTNGSLDLDADDDGLPDGWSIHKDAVCELVPEPGRGNVARFTDGYNVLAQDVQIEDLAGKVLRLRIDARSSDGAKLGVLAGYLSTGADGKATWRNHHMAWDRALTGEYTTFRLNRAIPAEAVGPRLWIGIYRSNKEGTLTVDKVAMALNVATPEEEARFQTMERGWRYLRERAEKAVARLGESPELSAIITSCDEVGERFFAYDPALLVAADELEREREALSAQLNGLVNPGAILAASFGDAYRRLGPADLAPTGPAATEPVVALPGEHQAIGLTLASAETEALPCTISVTGLPAENFQVSVRRQHFMETWYKKHQEVLADPLPLLPTVDGGWEVVLQPGEIAKLYIDLHCIAGPAVPAIATVRVARPGADPIELMQAVMALAAPANPLPDFGHVSFIYTNMNVAAHSPVETSADLGSHGVKMIEFAFMPTCEFTAEGELVTIDFSRQDRWMQAYCPNVERMMIFWAPTYDKFEMADGTMLEVGSKPWERAFVNLFTAFFEHAAELGYGMDRFSILPVDEPHSATFESAPDEAIALTVQVMKLCRETFPDLQQVVTLSLYTVPADVAEILPYMDIAIPHWPYPTKLKASFAPPEYNPRQAFADETWPMLLAEQERRGMEIWSYHVAAGKTDNELIYNRAYPLRAVGAGWTGIGHWAYNVSRGGTTWDDTDEGVDYIFVYDGTENSPLNDELNPTGEIVVPSIRWEGVRAGIQDAKLLLYLREFAATDQCAAALKPRIQSLLDDVRALAEDDANITWDAVADLSQQARMLYAESLPQ